MSAKFCMKCGARLYEGAEFCTNCGHPVPRHTPEQDAAVTTVIGGSQHSDTSNESDNTQIIGSNAEATRIIAPVAAAADGSISNVSAGFSYEPDFRGLDVEGDADYTDMSAEESEWAGDSPDGWAGGMQEQGAQQMPSGVDPLLDIRGGTARMSAVEAGLPEPPQQQVYSSNATVRKSHTGLWVLAAVLLLALVFVIYTLTADSSFLENLGALFENGFGGGLAKVLKDIATGAQVILTGLVEGLSGLFG